MKKFSSLLFVLLLMLASFTAGMEYPRGDVDYNGKVNIADVVTLVDYLLTGTWDEPVTPPDEHEWVDLGLPSGTLWATCNVGADNPEDYGDYFAWGETEPKVIYNWSTYKWCNGSVNTMTKYCTDSGYGTVDNKTELDPADDAATVNWGTSWRMPTLEQLDELLTKCTWTWTQQNGVNGSLVTGPNGNTIFLPAAGYHWDASLGFADSYGDYWSRALYSIGPRGAHDLCIHSNGVYRLNNYDRSGGRSVRAVRVS